MTEKRFEIVKSKLIKDGWVINDKLKQFTFPTLKGDKRALISYCKALNELYEEKEDWEHNCLKTVSENSILWNEISILREQGAEPTNAFKNYLNNLKNKHKKLQGDEE